MPDSKKHCHVCGQPAAGYNFHGFSCQACKIFFRRANLYYQKFICKGNNACSVVGPHQRSGCQSCRLNKCFAIGMKKELINAKYTKRKKPTLIIMKEKKKDDENCTTAKLPSKLYSSSEKSVDDLHFDLHHLTSLLLPHEAALFSELQQAMSSNFVDERRLPLSTSVSSNATPETSSFSTSSAELLLAVYNNHCCYIRRIIGFCKAISVYRRLPLADQLALLKEFYVDVLTLRAAVNYCPVEDSVRYLENDTGHSVLSMKLSLFRQAKIGGNEAEDGYRKFFLSMQALLENDETLRDLLIIYRLFELRAGITCPELVCYQQAEYGHLMLRYLYHCKHPKSWKTAKKKYHALLDKLTELKVLNSLSYQIILSYNREQLGQVVTEVFDI